MKPGIEVKGTMEKRDEVAENKEPAPNMETLIEPKGKMENRQNEEKKGEVKIEMEKAKIKKISPTPSSQSDEKFQFQPDTDILAYKTETIYRRKHWLSPSVLKSRYQPANEKESKKIFEIYKLYK